MGARHERRACRAAGGSALVHTRRGGRPGADRTPGTVGPGPQDLSQIARSIGERAGARAAVAIDATLQGGDTQARIAVAVDGATRGEARTVFLGGEQGRRRAALAACAALWEALDAVGPRDPGREPN